MVNETGLYMNPLTKKLIAVANGFCIFRLTKPPSVKYVLVSLICLSLSTIAWAQGDTTVFRIDSLPTQGLTLNKGWKFHAGDNPAWASPAVDDSRWDTLRPTRSIGRLTAIKQAGQGWLRLTFGLDSAVAQTAILMTVNQTGASEMYIDGRLYQRLGRVGADYQHQKAFMPISWDSYPLPPLSAGRHVMAVRISQHQSPWYVPKLLYASQSVFRVTLFPVATYTRSLVGQVYAQTLGNYLLVGIFLMLSVIHFMYYRYRRKRINLVFGLTLLFGAVAVVLTEFIGLLNSTVRGDWLFLLQGLLIASFMVMLLVTYYVYLSRPVSWMLSAIAVLLITYRLGAHLIGPSTVTGVLSMISTIALFADGIRVSINGIRSHRPNARFMLNSIIIMVLILVVGGVVSWFLSTRYPVYSGYAYAATNVLFFLTLPISFAIILAREYAQTSRNLEDRLMEVEQLSAEKETILTQQNATLEHQVSERTAELEHKNRELEIEATLDKVRSRSLAMHRSDELQDVVIIVFEKLKELGLVFDGGAGIQLFTEGSKDSILWVASPGQIASPSRINLPYDADGFRDNPIILDVWKAKETGEAIYNKTYTRDEKNRYFGYVFKHNDLVQVPRFVRDEIMQASGYTQAFVPENNSGVIANSWSGEVFPPDKFDVFKRISKVFDQAYIRFLDLQKAEAQAREAQIEVALERVRSRTMAMQHSEELAEVISVLCKGILNLGIHSEEMETCYITTFDENKPIGEIYLTYSNGDLIPQPFQIGYDEDPLFKQLFAGWKSGSAFIVGHLFGNKVIQHFDFLFSHVPTSITEMRVSETAQLPSETFTHALYFSQGYLAIVTRKAVPEYHEVFKRFGNTLQQAYTRFLDLQKAEAQAELARQNLILIQNEKQRAEDALTELKITQTQLIQKEKMASLGELTAGIAHEIQNPLNFVTNFSEVSTELVTELEEEHQKPDRDTNLEAELLGDLKQNLQKITHHGNRASSIVKGMLEHSRTSTGERQSTDLNALCDEYLRLAYQGLRAKDKPGAPDRFNCELVTHLDLGLPQVKVVPQEMGRVLLNLYNNAFYAVEQKHKTASSDYRPTVTVSTHLIPQHVPEGDTSLARPIGLEIRVRDNGTGMPEPVKAKIFQPFFTTKPTGEGTGLGLSLSYDIITKGHGGTLSVESQAGEGTEFIIRLPTSPVVSSAEVPA